MYIKLYAYTCVCNACVLVPVGRCRCMLMRVCMNAGMHACLHISMYNAFLSSPNTQYTHTYIYICMYVLCMYAYT